MGVTIATMLPENIKELRRKYRYLKCQTAPKASAHPVEFAPLTSSSPSRAEDSFCKTAMSRREDIVSCIDVTIMDRSAHSALPSSYSKIFPALRAGAAFTQASGLRRKSFIDLPRPHTVLRPSVQQPG